MIYIDTNVIVYSYVNIAEQKQLESKALIKNLISDQKLLLSPLVIQEAVFVLNKLKLDKDKISNIVRFFIDFSSHDIGNDLVLGAYEMCLNANRLKSINDAIHLKFAEKYGLKLITFDKGFNSFKPFTTVEIEVLTT